MAVYAKLSQTALCRCVCPITWRPTSVSCIGVIQAAVASAGASDVSFVAEDDSEGQEMQVGDDCEEYAEVQLLLPDCPCRDGRELNLYCRTRSARKTMAA